MPKTKKTKAKKAKKRVITCGKCKTVGHNARTCKALATVAEPAAEAAPEPAAAVEPKAEVVKSSVTTTTIETPELKLTPTRPRREAPTADMGTASTGAPYRCPKCNQVAILAIVRVQDYVTTQRTGKTVYKGETRCESCLNKPTPADLILVWGATPDQKVSAEEANAS